ncbi:hypothetical protein NIES25_48350 [Nostoc linckia NIES-25]|nr:hypothetical protein NIES25_48350 [Nostoc linckia NIES-25]
MAEVCKDIDAAIANLNRKLDEQNAKIRELERKQNQCCKGKNNNNSKDFDPSEILKRLAKAEKDILELGGVVKSVIDDVKDILDSLGEHNENAKESQNIFSAIVNFFIDEQ